MKYQILTSVKIGGVTSSDLLSRLETAGTIDDGWAPRVLRSGKLPTLDTQEDVAVIGMSLLEMGFPLKLTPIDNLFNPEWLAAWSKCNLKGFILDRCPEEVGPHFCDQHQKLELIGSKYETFTVVSKRVPDTEGELNLFRINFHNNEKPKLLAGPHKGGGRWDPKYGYLFRLRKAVC